MIDAKTIDMIRKLHALMGSDRQDGDVSRTKLNALLTKHGLTMNDVPGLLAEKPKAKPASPQYEDRAPVYQTYEQREAVRKMQGRRQIVAHYGSIEAALVPCEKEMALRDAVRRWATFWYDEPRWTKDIGGINPYSIPLDLTPHNILAALGRAFPLPTEAYGARKEFAYWTQRDQEIQLLREGKFLCCRLDAIPYMRQQIVRHLWRLDAGVDPVFSAELRDIVGAKPAEPEKVKLNEAVRSKPATVPPPRAKARKAEPPAKPRDELMVLPPHVLARYGRR
jgi:hypothetical protein